MPTLEQIQAKLKKLQAQAEVMIAKRAQSVLDDIRKLMEKHGLTTADIDAHSSTKTPRGRPAGKTSRTGGKLKAAAKAKLPAKYRNPKTGETWSGWARPPLWIKDVKDRTKFLIDGHSESHDVATSAAKPASKRAAKKVTAKTPGAKVPAKKASTKKASVKSVTVANAPAKKAARKKAPMKRASAKKVSAANNSATAAGTTTPAANQDSATALAVNSAI